MRDYFRDSIGLITEDYPNNKIVGFYDDHDDQYVVSLQDSLLGLQPNGSYSGYETLSFDDSVNGWISFYDYKPDFGFSHNKKFFTLHDNDLYEHYINPTRNTFYGSAFASYITFIANAEPSSVKNFLNINYEGTSYWTMESAKAEDGIRNTIQEAKKIDNAEVSLTGDIISQFKKKEDKYYSHITNNTGAIKDGVVGVDTAGISGLFSIVEMSNGYTGGEQELFSVSHNITKSS